MTDLSCQYSCTKCLNQRAKKRDGNLHRFCQFHREKANRCQRQLMERRRAQKAQTTNDNNTIEKRKRVSRTISKVSSLSPSRVEITANPKFMRRSMSIDDSSPRSVGKTTWTAPEFNITPSTTFEVYEPFLQPVELQIEDLYCLYSTVLDCTPDV